MLKDYYPMTDRFYLLEEQSNLYEAKWGQVIQTLDLNDDKFQPLNGMNFAILGFKCDKGVYINNGRPGAVQGPMAIRQQLVKLPWHLGRNVKVFDVGDVEGVNTSLSELQASLAEVIARLLSLNLFPIVLGGGHETAFGHYSGLSQFDKDTTIGIINFDAHFDLRPYDITGPNSGTGFRQIHDLNVAKERPYHYLALGIQEHSNNLHLFDYVAKTAGIEFMTGLDMYQLDVNQIKLSLDAFLKKVEKIYITIDMDCFNSAHSPGVSAIQSMGLDPRLVVILLEHIAASGKLMSFDIVELSPAYDQDQHSANLAATMVFYLSQILSQNHRASSF